jgi:hypothetical protein
MALVARCHAHYVVIVVLNNNNINGFNTTPFSLRTLSRQHLPRRTPFLPLSLRAKDDNDEHE